MEQSKDAQERGADGAEGGASLPDGGPEVPAAGLVPAAERAELLLATARLLAAGGLSPGRRELIGQVERYFEDFRAGSGVGGPVEPDHIAAWVMSLWQRGCSTSTIAAYLSALDKVVARRGCPAGLSAMARQVLAALKRLHRRRPKHAVVLTEEQILALLAAAQPGRGNIYPATAILIWLLRAPLCQLRSCTEAYFGPGDSWVDIVLPEATSGRWGHFARRVVRLEAMPGDLCCPVYAVRALRAYYPTGPLLRRAEVRSMYPLPRINPTSPAWGDDATEEEVRALVLHLSRERLMAARDCVMICGAYGGVLRLGEAVGAQVEDLDGQPWGYRLRLRRSKANQQGQAEFVRLARRDDGLCPVAAIDAWLRLVPWRSGPLVPSLRGGDVRRPDLPPPGMQTQSALARLRRLGELAGIDVPIGSHTLRRSGAQRIYDQTRHLRRVQEALRHTNPTTTLRYLEDTDDSGMGEAS